MYEKIYYQQREFQSQEGGFTQIKLSTLDFNYLTGI